MAQQSAARLKLAHNDYNVGWVCALPKEQTAAVAMLDERHVGLPKPPNDYNTYSLGSIGMHNIVIACLPKGRIGTNSAATVATSMANTFPNIKFGLMVGIGGGIPPKVRLGDVVVSTPVGQFPGVVQWDMGKAKSGSSFERTGALNNPPTLLLTALTALESEHELTGTKIPGYLDDLKTKWPRLAPKYLKSDSMEDVLFKPDSGHVIESAMDPDEGDEDDGDDENNSCQLCDRTKVVKRKPRDMRVLYGLIASGNQVIKDATFRDKLYKDLGGQVLCVDMEAAGLMNNFPCIVIRGICDYADSHKNKDWQAHAAAVAAAFAKELLGYVQPNEVDRERPVKDVLGQVLESVEEVRHKLDDKADLEVLDWLTTIDYGPHQSDYFNRREPGTGQWLLDSDKYKTWCEQPSETLFCPGIPGAGKTILTSIVIDDLCTRFHHQPSVGIAYIYFNYKRKDEQRYDDILASLLKQFSQSQATIPEAIKDLYDRHKTHRTRPSSGEIVTALQSVMGLYSRALIILDALDECHLSTAGKVLSYLSGLQTKSATSSIFATSRFVSEITEHFNRSPSLEIRADLSDVRRYLEGRILKLPSIVRDRRDLQEEIVSKISNAVDGMFLLAQIYLDSLDDKLTITAIRTALGRLQKQHNTSDKAQVLTDAYDQTMYRINAQRPGFKDLAMRVLSWLTYAQRQLTALELQHALAVNASSDREIDADNLPAISDIVSACAGLVTIEAGDIVRFVHYTTQEYFSETRDRWFPDAEKDVTDICTAYLSFDVFEGGYCTTDIEFEERLKSYPLYNYAACNWGYHAFNTSASNQIAIGFLKDENKVGASNQANLVSKGWNLGESQKFGEVMTGLHLTALYGLTDATHVLLSEYQSDLKNELLRIPLFLAAAKGHEAIVRMLLEKGGDIEHRQSWSPLIIAVRRSHKGIVRLLLEKGANVNVEDDSGWSPLFTAIRKRNKAIIRLLLERGGKTDVRDYSREFDNYFEYDRDVAIALAWKGGWRSSLRRSSRFAPSLHLGSVCQVLLETEPLTAFDHLKKTTKVIATQLETDSIIGLPKAFKKVQEHMSLVHEILLEIWGKLVLETGEHRLEAVPAILKPCNDSARELKRIFGKLEKACRKKNYKRQRQELGYGSRVVSRCLAGHQSTPRREPRG